ncbi:unnamed protein product [Rotaria sp. Silwood1]|nr:unnamed protein product [Rotaria sp. Silwood1]CAF1444094.1 unnamed protein product [Rotaria sp. Silwood1]CAF3717487.1 unnamed protein product [Rotaria sp. Silwood1]CAF4750228.1 unnamed protein product [Rotaria sp. Silwood1]
MFENFNKRLNSSNQTNITSQLSKTVVVSHFHENLDWLDLLVDDQISYVVYTRSAEPLTHYHRIAINKGREAIVYLRYIVDHYSNLPSSIAFVQAHRTSWHQKDPSDIVIALRTLQWNKYTYMPLTSTRTYNLYKQNSFDLQERVNYELWQAVLQKELGPSPINGTYTYCCATFAVKREAILAHPTIFYSNIIDYILTSQHSDQLTGRTLEYTWHMIFGEPTHINYRTCDISVCDSRGIISVSLAKNKTQ